MVVDRSAAPRNRAVMVMDRQNRKPWSGFVGRDVHLSGS